MTTDLEAVAKKQGIKYFLICFSDICGVQRSKLVPASAIAGMQEDGAGFAGFATYLDMTPAHPDVFAIPDPESLIQLPWKPEVGWVAADPHMYGRPVEHAPRVVLKRAMAKARDMGFAFKSGVEPECFFITPDGNAIADPADTRAKPCYDQQALMRHFDVVAEISGSMESLGWGAYQNDHEDANGQFEMNWNYDDGLKTADRHTFFKFLAKSAAERHGLRVTFMPKPFINLTGNGCHVHLSLWDLQSGKNRMTGDGPLGLSQEALHFAGGLIAHAGDVAAVTNPTVNSYKRINAPRTTSGSTWAPNSVTWAGNNRTHMIRVPGAGRIETRLPDAAADPYLLQASTLLSGLDGIDNRIDPGEPLDIDMYAEGYKVKDAKKLPLNLLDAIRAFENSKTVRRLFGEEFVRGYAKIKTNEWNAYAAHLSNWERQHTLDC